MVTAHRTLALVVVLLALAGALWAAQNWLSRGAVGPRLTAFTVAMSGVVGVQALLGIVLAVQGNRPVDGTTHFIVGPLTLLALPVARRLAGTGEGRRAAILTGGWVVLLLLSLRAVGSGGGLT